MDARLVLRLVKETVTPVEEVVSLKPVYHVARQPQLLRSRAEIDGDVDLRVGGQKPGGRFTGASHLPHQQEHHHDGYNRGDYQERSAAKEQNRSSSGHRGSSA